MEKENGTKFLCEQVCNIFLLRTHTQTQIYVINYCDYFLPLCLLFGTLFKTGCTNCFFFFEKEGAQIVFTFVLMNKSLFMLFKVVQDKNIRVFIFSYVERKRRYVYLIFPLFFNKKYFRIVHID